MLLAQGVFGSVRGVRSVKCGSGASRGEDRRAARRCDKLAKLLLEVGPEPPTPPAELQSDHSVVRRLRKIDADILEYGLFWKSGANHRTVGAR